MELILTRHTKTDWNLQGRIQGQTDRELTESGRKEAEGLIQKLKNLRMVEIFSSDLKRARQTAEIINLTLGLPLIFDKRLKECSFGNVEGLTKQQAVEKYGSSILTHWEDIHRAYDFRPFGGEHRDDVLARHIEIVKSPKINNPGKIILLVSHGRGMCTLLLGLDQKTISRTRRLSDCEIKFLLIFRFASREPFSFFSQ